MFVRSGAGRKGSMFYKEISKSIKLYNASDVYLSS